MKTNRIAASNAVLLTGEITSTRKLNIVSRNPVLATGTLPLLYGELMKDIWSEGARTPTYLGHGALRGNEQILLSFRFQVGATMVYWLADPHDREIVTLLRTWVTAKTMSVALKTKAGVAVLTRDYVEIPQSIAAVCEVDCEMDTERFLRSATEMVASGLLQSNATSDIPSIRKLKNVHAFFVLSAKANAAIANRAH
jgi:hypothetical protein